MQSNINETMYDKSLMKVTELSIKIISKSITKHFNK